MITLQQAVQDFLEAKRAQRLSDTTLVDYTSVLKRFMAFVGKDKFFSEISKKDISSYLASLNVSKKRVKNIYITLSSLWTWGIATGVCQEHVLRALKPPKPEKRAILPLTEDEIRAMLNAIENGVSLWYSRPGKSTCRHSLPAVTVRRDKAILLFLLDTGVRASELCNLRIRDIGIIGARIFGKGAKERIVPLSEITRQAIDDYLIVRNAKPADALFVTIQEHPLTHDTLASIIGRIAQRAGVLGAHPHKFRHTFAVNFLRNGGDIFSLQAILGHETLEMVKHYVAIAKTDIQRSHAKASPVKNWNL